MKYHQEANYKLGVEMFKNGATQVLLTNEYDEHKSVSSLNNFKSTYKLIREFLEQGVVSVTKVQ